MADDKKQGTLSGAELQGILTNTPLASLLENITVSFWTTDKNLVFTAAAGALKPDGGVDPGALVGAHLRDVWPVPDVVAAHESALAGEATAYGYETGGKRYRGRVNPMYDTMGRCYGTVGVALDISGEHAARMLLEKRDAGFNDLLKHIPYGMVIIDRHGKIVFVNETICELYGLPVSEVVGIPFTNFLPRKNLPYLRDMFLQRIQGKIGAGSYRTELVNRAGRVLHIQIYAALMQYEGEPADLLFVQDVGEQVVAERAIQTLVTGMAGRVGRDFFDHAVRSVADWLKADTVAVGRIDGGYMKALAMVDRHRNVDDYFFAYRHSPCKVALDRGFCLFPERVRELFPGDEYLKTFNAEAFAGAVIRNDLTGEPIGCIIASAAGRLDAPRQTEQVFEIIAAKASAEMLRQTAVNALDTSEERFRRLFRNAPVSLWVEDFGRVKARLDELHGGGVADLRAYFEAHPDEVRACAKLVDIVDVNTYTVQLFGAGGKERFLASLDTIFVDESYQTFAEELAVLYDRERFIAADTVNRTLDGRTIHVRLNAAPAPGHEDDWRQVVVSMDDVTASKRLEAALRRSDEQLRQVSDNLQDVLWLLDIARGTFVFVSRAYAGIWGRPADALLANRDAWAAAVHPDDRKRAEAAFGDVQRGTAAELEYRIVRPDGAVRWIHERMFPIADAGETAHRAVGIAKDVTARKKDEEELSRYRRELEKLVVVRTRELTRREQALEAVYAIATSPFNSFRDVCDEAVRALAYLVNVPAVRIQRVTAGNSVVMAAVPADESAPHYVEHALCGPCRTVCERGETMQLAGDLAAEHPDAVCLVEGGYRSYLGVPIGDHGGTVTALICAMDVTERTFEEGDIHLVEIFARYLGHIMENMRLEERVRSTRENELYTKLTSGVAHEVRNPLNAILAITEVLSMELGDAAEYKEYIDHIRNQVDRLSMLMRDLLDLGKPLQLNNIRPVPVADLCRAAVDLWKQSTAFGRHRVELDVPADGGPAVNVDDTRLNQIFINLLENAAQHSPAGSVIRVGAGRRMGRVFVDVRDEGCGIAPDRLEKVFDPFFTTRKGGAGLGMSIVRHFVHLHDGTVTAANNEPAPGCTVSVLLPEHGGNA